MKQIPGTEPAATHFLELIRKSRTGKFKIYIGMSAGVGKTFRMLQEAHTLLRSGADVRIGYVETHDRPETAALLAGLPLVPRRRLFYKGKALEEFDLQAVLNLRPEIVVVDELAHTNIEGSLHEKRWQDVIALLEAGIHVISAVNIQHIESLQEPVRSITGVTVAERIPDKLLFMADEVVNIDLTADELVTRLKEGKIYKAEKIQAALQHFFRPEHILQLRELALKEVASYVEQKVARTVPRQQLVRQERFLACISSNEKNARKVIRKTARLANYYQSSWLLLYVQLPAESADRVSLARQRHLINNFKLATELGGKVLRREGSSISSTIANVAEAEKVTTICLGKPRRNFLRIIMSSGVFHKLLNKLSSSDIDLVILS